VKLRASPHSDALRLYSIDDGGIRIEDGLPEQEGLLGGRPTQMRAAPSPATQAGS
jgi:circadian clock protein KaiC